MNFIMSVDSFIALIGLTIATAITLGPNNAMVAASGAHFGVLPKRSWNLFLPLGAVTLTIGF